MALYANFFAEKMSSFCIGICESYSHFFFFRKNNCELDIVLIRTVNILTTNALVKLTMPRSSCRLAPVSSNYIFILSCLKLTMSSVTVSLKL